MNELAPVPGRVRTCSLHRAMTAASRGQTHEDFSRDEEVRGSSDRSFGVVFTVVFALVGLFPLLRGGGPRPWALALAGAFLLAAVARPSLLGPLNRLWLRFGLVLHRVVSPVVLGFLFFVVVTPIGSLMRMLGRRPLQLDFDPEANSYWIPRHPAGPDPESMKRQF